MHTMMVIGFYLLVLFGTVKSELSLASYFGDHMVLQRAPASSQIWGYADKLDTVVTAQVGLEGPRYSTKTVNHSGLKRIIWKITFPPQNAEGSFVITISSTEGTLSIQDVIFGDVWVCSGQSNMQFTLNMVYNSTQEMAEADNYPDIRLFTVQDVFSAEPLYELKAVQQPWSRASKESVGGADWTYFSAVCWLYGKYLYQQLKRPIGLVASTWGGTPVEAWSSKDAMAMCASPSVGLLQSDAPSIVERPNSAVPNFGVADQNTPTQLWNAMINPLLNMTIYGAIWYQGEANAGAPDSYKCRFQAMINDWRAKFSAEGHTDGMFPFGFVQLAPWRNDPTIITGFPDIRWHQTFDYGYVPNPELPKVFMAVAIDLPDFDSPYNSIHPRDKQDIAWRLTLSGLQVAYNMSSLGRYLGPQISAYYIDIGYHTLRLEFDGAKGQGISVTNTSAGFEVCCSINNMTKCDGKDSVWQAAPITASDSHSVTMRSCVGMWTMGVRYAWAESPCAFKACAVYTRENSLPMAPFVVVGVIGDDAN
ncbi:sialate O-acetylesterase-like isoform X3 [Dreissena polymorpha]|nr:sialate O-acetylesterase-like isoform X3 [Dreissena polymorpha]